MAYKTVTLTSFAALFAALWIVPAAAVGLYGGDPIERPPEVVEHLLCLQARPSDKSLCDAQYEQRMLQRTLELLPSLATDPKLLLLPPRLSDEELRHKEMMNKLQGIEDALRRR
jgi:hypothetical protein